MAHEPASTALVRPSAAAIAFDAISGARASAEGIAARRATRLGQLLTAARGTRHYHRALRGLNPATATLAALPVTGKLELMQHFADRVADPRIRLADLRAFCADPANIGRPFIDRYWVWESSGSTGLPGYFVQDETAMAVYDALEASRRRSPRPLARLLDPLCLGERFAFVGAIGGHFASQVSVRRLQHLNPWLARLTQSFSILQPTADLVAQLNAFAPSVLATYPTAAVLLAEEAERGALRIRPQELWTGGETLTPAMRKRITRGFDCALRDSYGASEFLPMAFECEHGRLHLNADWVILEAVDSHHRPSPAGQPSHTTLLTNLANHVQPLIRFDIGDCIAFDVTPCPCGSALPTLQVQGRRDDMLRVAGRDGGTVTLLPLALTTVLEDEAGVFDFELRQKDALTWRLTLGSRALQPSALGERCRKLLTEFALAQGAAAPRIQMRFAATLPLGRSGKRKRVIACG